MKKTILLIDDEHLNNVSIVNAFEDIYICKAITNPLLTFSVLDKFDVDCIICDIYMPQINGIELFSKILEHPKYKHIPVIFVTGSKKETDLVSVLEKGAKDLLTKPINLEELRLKLDIHIKNYHNILEIKQQKEFFNETLNNLPEMVFLFENKENIFMNQYALDFFHSKDIEDFKNNFNNFEEIFIKENGFWFPQHNGDWFLNQLEDNLNLNDKFKHFLVLKTRRHEHRYFKYHIKKQNDNKYVLILVDSTNDFVRERNILELANTDVLTGCFNRNYFDENINEIISENRLNDYETGVIFFDIEYFKFVNDHYSHQVGDESLKHLIETINKNKRKDDLIFRWGGDEFLLVVPIRTKEELFSLCEKFRTQIENEYFDIIKHVTCSFGGTIIDNDMTMCQNIDNADKMLYKSKNNGRNQTNIFKLDQKSEVYT